MRLEVLSKDDMNTLSRELSRAGVMNRTKEETSSTLVHYIVIRGKYLDLAEKASGIPILEDALEEVRATFEELLEEWEPGSEKDLTEIFGESDLIRLLLVTAMLEAGFVREEEGRLVLMERPTLEELPIELRFPIEELEEDLEKVEDAFQPKMITEFTLEKRYYVEVMEVERELIETALEIAEEYATEESLVEAMFEGISKSVLAETILKLAKEYRRKNELIEAIMSMEPITVETERERINIYFDEEALEDFLKDLQTLGYLKVKGNRVWV
ncbi:MAG: hypothetical protein PWQ79_2284 [Thermococcaceae archaeon]|nr:hypothetical protein [Thermococcaceae archaeon]